MWLSAMNCQSAPATVYRTTAGLRDNANANIARRGDAEDLVQADLDQRSQKVEYFDGADSTSGDDEDGSEDAWSLTGR